MSLCAKLLEKKESLSLIGLGYVGMPIAVAHREFKALSLNDIKTFYRVCPDEEKVLLDIKGLYKIADLKASGLRCWRL